MSEFLRVLLLAALPALGNFGGGLLAEAFRISQRTLSLALHAAAGIVIAVIGIELMPEVLEATPAWVPILAFMGGGGLFLLLDKLAGVVQGRVEEGASAAPWAIFFGVAVDLFSDGLMIGTGSTLNLDLALLLALGQVSADIPEGFATIASFRNRGVPRRTRFLVSLAFVIPVMLGATLGYWGVRGGPELLKLVLLALTAGILLTVVIEEIMPEAHREDEARLAALFLVGGFALFALVAVYLE